MELLIKFFLLFITVIMVLVVVTAIILIFYEFIKFWELLDRDTFRFIEVINIRHFEDNIITILIHHLVGDIIGITNYKAY